MNKEKLNQSGQVLLLVLLAMAVLATMMLSVVSRSVSEVGVTTREEESLRAFSAAEAGVEEALITGTQEEILAGPIEVTRDLEAEGSGTSTVSTFTARIGRYPETAGTYNYPFEVASGQTASVWLATKDGDNILPCGTGECFGVLNTIQLCWGAPGGESTAVFVNVIYQTPSGSYASAPIGYDPDDTRRITGSGSVPANNFLPAGGSCTIEGKNYQFSAGIDFIGVLNIPATATPVLMRVTPLYNTTPQPFGVNGGGSNLPIQGRQVSSEGVAGESTRRIDAYLLNPEIPFILDVALYSREALTK